MVKDKSGEFSSSEMKEILGSNMTYYCKGVMNKSESSGLYQGYQLYTGGDTIYTYELGSDTVFYELISDKNDELIDWEVIEEGPSILGFKTKRIFYQTMKESNEVYFSDDFRVNVPDENSSLDAQNFFLNLTTSIFLKSLMDDDEVNVESEAIKIIGMELPESIFEIPKGIRVKM